MSTQNPTLKNLMRYGFIAMPMSFAGLPLYIHMPDFYTREFGIHIGVLGIILLAIRLFDAVQDPVIGYIADRQSSHRLLVIMTGVVALMMGMAGLSFGPLLDMNPSLWFAVFMILATTGFSLISININMIGGFWRDDNGQRARISAWREAFGLVGLLCAALLPTAAQLQVSVADSFILLFAVFAALMTIAGYLFIRFMNDVDITPNKDTKKDRPVFALLSILKGREKAFFGLCFLSYLAASLPAALVLFFIRDYLNAEELAGLFLVLYFISGAIFIGLWVKLSRRYGLYKTWFFAMILAVITFMFAAFLEPGDVVLYGIICVLSGLALGADLALPPAIIAERISESKQEKQATQYYAVLAFLPKVAMAIAAGVSFVVLGHYGFEAGAENNEISLDALLYSYAVAPCFIKIAAIFILYHVMKGQEKRQ